MKHLLLIIVSVVIVGNQSYSQAIATDSRGKDVFNFYTTKAFTLPITTANTSIKLGYNVPIGFFDKKEKHGTQYHVKSFQPQNFTVATSQSLNVLLSVSDLSKNLATISTFHPSYGISIGYSQNIDLFNNWNQIRTLKNTIDNILCSYSITGYINTSNLLVYDTVSQTPTRRKPVTAGATAEFTYFNKYARFICASLSVNYENGWNVADLKNYQKNKPTYSNSNVISLGDYVGKIGDLQNANSFRFRFAIPIFIDGFKSKEATEADNFLNKITHISIIPYYSVYGAVNSRFNKVIGTFINLLGEKFGYNSKIVPGGGIGIDWIKSPKGWTSPNIFISGTFSFDSFFKHEDPGKGQATK